MSRHFNYELDERRIKILLKETSMPYSEDVWNEYLANTKPIVKANKLPQFKPVSFAINKTVFLSFVFIVLLGSFTVIIAKFVDFSKSATDSELVREVKPDPSNFKPVQATIAVQPKKETPKPEAKPAVDSSLIAAKTITTTVVTTPSVAPVTVPKINTNPVVTEQPKARMKPENAIVNPNKDSSGVTQNSGEKQGRKKKKKQVETLESKPLTTELPTAAPEEPELELK